MPTEITEITVGVLALQGAFHEHLLLLHQASTRLRQRPDSEVKWQFNQVRNRQQLEACDALIIPGGESTTVSLVAARSGLLEPLREFVKIHHRPTWGTCAGLILLAESANRTKKGGQELIGGLDVRVNRNYFGRQAESFERDLHLPFLEHRFGKDDEPFKGIFIRAPVVEKVLATVPGAHVEVGESEGTVFAPPCDSLKTEEEREPIKLMGTLPPHSRSPREEPLEPVQANEEAQEIIAVMQNNCFGTSFHPELTQDPRIHIWWLEQVKDAVLKASPDGSLRK